MDKSHLLGKVCATVVAFIIFQTSTISSASIVQPVSEFGSAFFNYETFGQTFIAEDPFISDIGVLVADLNQHLGTTFTLTMTLYAGIGTSVPVISTITNTLPTGFGLNTTGEAEKDWWDFDLNNRQLDVGSAYTFTVDSIDGDRGFIYWHECLPRPNLPCPPDVYTGGELVLDGVLVDNLHPGRADLAFRVLSQTSTIPIPPALWLFGSGLLGLVGIARKTTRTRQG